MDALQDFQDDEQADLDAAAAAMATYWRAAGLGAQVVAIGREQGVEGAKVLLATYFDLRAQRLKAERDAERDDDDRIPF